jgi:hypothetical protein
VLSSKKYNPKVRKEGAKDAKFILYPKAFSSLRPLRAITFSTVSATFAAVLLKFISISKREHGTTPGNKKCRGVILSPLKK